MQLDYVDIFYLHCQDDATPLEESILALDHAVRQGKVLYAAISNHTSPALEKAVRILMELHTPFVLLQNSYSMLNRRIEKNGVQQFAVNNGHGIIAFKPLEQGLLTGKYLNGIPADSRIRTDGRYLREGSLNERNHQQVAQLQQLATQRGQTLAEMALAWVYNRPGVASVLIGASRPQQILDNLRMLYSPPFSEEELALIDQIAAL
jgi:L-glyceraldehyde 3-phosphate reductase